MKNYFVYIATNYSNTVLYTGITNDVERRMYEHKNKLVPGFTSKYQIKKLIYFQEFSDVLEAIDAEKKIKGWTRQKKLDLIKTDNPDLKDLLETDPSLRSG